MDNAPHYMLVSTDDRDYLARAIEAMPESHERTRLLDRFRNETGAPIAEIAETLAHTPVCAACSIEGQASGCESIRTAATGRRLRRLVEIARGERFPWRTKP